MYFVIVGIWLLICLARLYKTPLLKGVAILMLSSVLLAVLLYQFGTPQGAGIALSMGVVPSLIRLLTSGIQKLQQQNR